jgi:hypothetical protein
MLALTLETDNAAFEDAPAEEVARIFEALAARLRAEGSLPSETPWPIRDLNGNRVGSLERRDP